MLTRFSVSNFKGFNEEFVFDLQNPNGYEFNETSVKNGIVNHAIIYGRNGVGKSNLGVAIFDIIGHLTDLDPGGDSLSLYSNYLNALNKSDTAQFHYEFLIESNEIIYKYQKIDYKTIVSESFSINGQEFISINRKINNEAQVNLKGTEHLKTTLPNSNLSVLKYVKNNSVLDENNENQAFLNFFKFIEGLLFFKTLDENIYLGIEIGEKEVQEDIIKNGNISDLEIFLNIAGIECKLAINKQADKDIIVFDFNGSTIPLFDTASTGTVSLILFYFWLQRLRKKSKVSFLFIDEFDAFYHHKLSALVVEELKKTGVQFILTTHNTSIISNDLLRPDCYFLMGKQSIKSLAKSTRKELREAHNIEKMYKAGSFYAQ